MSPKSFTGICQPDQLGQSGAPPALAAYLLATEVHYRILDVQVQANITQTYISALPDPSEVLYCFALPPDAAVHAFSATFQDGRVINGVVKTKLQAKEVYDEAVRQGKRAGLLESLNAEVFHIRLGNLGPRETVTVCISIVSLLPPNATPTSARITFPASIAPRYGAAPPEFLAQNTVGPESGMPKLKLSASILMNGRIKGIGCLSHALQVRLGSAGPAPASPLGAEAEGHEEDALDPRAAYVELVSDELLGDASDGTSEREGAGDVVLTLDSEGLDAPRCFVEYADEVVSDAAGGKSGTRTEAYALTFVQTADLPPPRAQEYVFLIDRSGSMDDRMSAMRRALRLILKSLPASSSNTSFNLLSFGSTFSALWPASLPYSAASVRVAEKHIGGMQADMGGTEIRGALEFAVGQSSAVLPPTDGEAVPAASGIGASTNGASTTTPKKDSDGAATSASSPTVKRVNGETDAEEKSVAIFLVTDGQSWDVDATVALVQRAREVNPGRLRFFVLGLGDGVSTALCDAIARAGHGQAVYVREKERPDAQLVRLVKAAQTGVMSDLHISWPGSEGLSDGTPPAYDATVDSPSLAVEQAPSAGRVPPIYPGFRTSLYAVSQRSTVGRSENDNSGNGDEGAGVPPSVRLTATVSGQAFTLDVPVFPIYRPLPLTPTTSASSTADTMEAPAPPAHNILHILAARTRLQELDDRFTSLDGVRNAELRAVLQAEGERLGVTYGLVSRWTSFVAVDEGGEAIEEREGGAEEGGVVEEEKVHRLMRSASLAGGAPSGSVSRARVARKASMGSPVLLMGVAVLIMPFVPFYLAGLGVKQGYRKVRALVHDKKEQMAKRSEERKEKLEEEGDVVSRLVYLQAVDGSFVPGTPEADAVLKMVLQSRKGVLPPLPNALAELAVQPGEAAAEAQPRPQRGGAIDAPTVWFTMLVLAFMETALAAEEDGDGGDPNSGEAGRAVWGLMAEKAEAYVHAALGRALAHGGKGSWKGVPKAAEEELDVKTTFGTIKREARRTVLGSVEKPESERVV